MVNGRAQTGDDIGWLVVGWMLVVVVVVVGWSRMNPPGPHEMVTGGGVERGGWQLTGKKPEGAIGPPGMPSFGGNCPSGLGAGPALCAIPFTPYPELTKP